MKQTYQIPVLLLGNHKTGKSTLIHRLLHNEFKEEIKPTIEMDCFAPHCFEKQNKNMKFKFTEITKGINGIFMRSYIQNSDIVIVCIDNTTNNIDEQIEHWNSKIAKNRKKLDNKIFLFTKSDLNNETTSSNHLRETIGKNITCSARTGNQIDDLKQLLINCAMQSIKSKKLYQTNKHLTFSGQQNDAIKALYSRSNSCGQGEGCKIL